MEHVGEQVHGWLVVTFEVWRPPHRRAAHGRIRNAVWSRAHTYERRKSEAHCDERRPYAGSSSIPVREGVNANPFPVHCCGKSDDCLQLVDCLRAPVGRNQVVQHAQCSCDADQQQVDLGIDVSSPDTARSGSPSRWMAPTPTS